MNILISGRPTGRLASRIATALRKDPSNIVIFQENIWDLKMKENLHAYDVYISTAWNTKGNYKEDPINEEYAFYTCLWLDACKEKNIYSIYLGTSDNSGFEDCLYHRCKNKCDSHADTVLKIPYVWQPSRVGSLAWKVAKGDKYEITSHNKICYITEDEIIETVEKCLNEHFINHNTIGKIELANKNAESLETWVSRFS